MEAKQPPPPPKNNDAKLKSKETVSNKSNPPPPPSEKKEKQKKSELKAGNAPAPPPKPGSKSTKTQSSTNEEQGGIGNPPPPPKKNVSPRKNSINRPRRSGSPRKSLAPPPPPKKEEDSDDSDEDDDDSLNGDAIAYFDHIDIVGKDFFCLCDTSCSGKLTPEDFVAGTIIVGSPVSLKRVRTDIMEDYKLNFNGFFDLQQTLEWFHGGSHIATVLLSKCKDYCKRSVCDEIFELICSFDRTTIYGTKVQRSDKKADIANKRFNLDDLSQAFQALKLSDSEGAKKILGVLVKGKPVTLVEAKYNKWIKNVNARSIERCFRHISNGSTEEDLSYNNYVNWFMDSNDKEINNIIVHQKIVKISNIASSVYSKLCRDGQSQAHTDDLVERLDNLGVTPSGEDFKANMVRELGYSVDAFDAMKIIDKAILDQLIASGSSLSRSIVRALKDFEVRTKQKAEEEEQQALQKLKDSREAKKQEEQNKKWLHRMAMVFTKETWPKSLKGFLKLCNAIKNGLAWEDPMYKNQPDAIKKERIAQVRFILKKVFRQFQQEIDRLHKLVEENEYYESHEEDYWEWRMKEQATLLEEKISRSNAASSTKTIVRNGIRCLAEYTKHLLRVDKKVKALRERDAERGREMAISRVHTKVTLDKLREQEEAEQTAREEEIKLQNMKPVEFYENIAKGRLHAVTSKKIMDEINEVETKLEPLRIARVADFFQGFGKESGSLTDKRQYLKGLKMELEEQYVVQHKRMRRIVSVSNKTTRKRVSKKIRDERLRLSPLHVFRGKLSKDIDRGLAKLKRNSVHTIPRHLV